MNYKSNRQIIERLESILAEARYARLQTAELLHRTQGELAGIENEIDTYENLILWCKNQPPLKKDLG